MSNITDNIKRRSFIKKVWIAIGAIAGIEVIVIISNFLSPKGKRKEIDQSHFFEAGNIEDFPANSISSFRNRNFFLCRLKNGDFLALSSKCTHLGCALVANTEKNLLECPCHSSIFTIKGEVLRSPATRHLDQHEVKIENNKVMVNLATTFASVNSYSNSKHSHKA